MTRRLKKAFFITYTLFILYIIVRMMYEKTLDGLLEWALGLAYFVGIFNTNQFWRER